MSSRQEMHSHKTQAHTSIEFGTEKIFETLFKANRISSFRTKPNLSRLISSPFCYIHVPQLKSMLTSPEKL